jgi:hypothetical protein
MKELINGQTIDFDLHKAGDRSATSIDGLHMHKRMNGKKYKGVDVLFPLDDKENFEFKPKSTPDQMQRQIIKEISRAIKKNASKRDELVNTITNEIERHINEKITDNNIGMIRRGAERVAKIFSKEGKIRNELMQKIEDRLEFIITTHSKDSSEWDKRGKTETFFVKQDFKRNRIKISDDLEALNYGNAKRKF